MMNDDDPDNLNDTFRQSFLQQMESLREGERMSWGLRALLWTVVIMIVIVLALAR